MPAPSKSRAKMSIYSPSPVIMRKLYGSAADAASANLPILAWGKFTTGSRRARVPKDPNEGYLSLRKKDQSISPTRPATIRKDTRACPIICTELR